MASLLRALRKLPIAKDITDIWLFLNRELVPFLQELKSKIDQNDDDHEATIQNVINSIPPPNEPLVPEEGIMGPPGQKGDRGIQGIQGPPGISFDDLAPEILNAISSGAIPPILPTTPQFIPDQRVLGNDSGKLNVATAITVHQELDWIGGSKQWMFDGVDDDITFGDVLDFETNVPFSVSGWFNSQSTLGGIITKQAAGGAVGWGIFFLNPTGELFFRLIGTGTLEVKTNLPYNDGILHRFVCTYDGSRTPAGVAFYIDGSVVSTTTLTNTLSANSSLNAASLKIGNRGTSSPSSGIYANFSIWNIQLSSGQAIQVMGSSPFPDLSTLSFFTNCVLWVYLDDTDTNGANGVIDHSVSGFNGSAEGGLNVTTPVGSIPVRNTQFWQLLQPSFVNTVLTSNGVNQLPSYKSLSIVYPITPPGNETDLTGISESVLGPPGIQGIQGIQGIIGPPGTDGTDGSEFGFSGFFIDLNQISGRLIKSTAYTNTSGTHTFDTRCKQYIVWVKAPDGGGGGATSIVATCAVGASGGKGINSVGFCTAAPTTITFNTGTAGAAGANTGTDGGNATNATWDTLTYQGGNGGIGSASATGSGASLVFAVSGPGGASGKTITGSLPTGFTLLMSWQGENGEMGIVLNGTTGWGGGANTSTVSPANGLGVGGFSQGGVNSPGASGDIGRITVWELT